MRRWLTRILAYGLLSSVSTLAFGQGGPPATDIYLADLSKTDAGFKLGQPLNITNRDGYDNQPMFLPDGKVILYTSIQNGQADIFSYNLASGKTIRVTETNESEYSPTPMLDGQHFSVVRVEADSSQRLWKFPLAGGTPSLLLTEIKPVGYHAWADANNVALFVLGQTNSLHFANLTSGKSDSLVGSIGRSLHKMPGREAISFVEKVRDEEWWIKSIAIATREIQPLTQTLAGSEDYAWTPDGTTILMGNNARLYAWNAKNEDWLEIASLDSFGLKTITRLAVSPFGDKIAMVAAR